MSDFAKGALTVLLIVGVFWYIEQSAPAPSSLQVAAPTATVVVVTSRFPSSTRDLLRGPDPPPDPTIGPGTTPAVPDGLSWRDALAHVGEWVAICGPVVSTSFRPDVNGSPTFLNIGRDFPDPTRFQVVIWGENLGNFDYEADTLYDNREVCVSGEVVEFNGVAEMEVVEPGQVEVIR